MSKQVAESGELSSVAAVIEALRLPRVFEDPDRLIRIRRDGWGQRRLPAPLVRTSGRNVRGETVGRTVCCSLAVRESRRYERLPRVQRVRSDLTDAIVRGIAGSIGIRGSVKPCVSQRCCRDTQDGLTQTLRSDTAQMKLTRFEGSHWMSQDRRTKKSTEL